VSGVRCQEKTQKLKPEICDLEFLFTLADFRTRGKSIQAPSGASPRSAPFVPDSILIYPPMFFHILARKDQNWHDVTIQMSLLRRALLR
jgi:hypothetical protein